MDPRTKSKTFEDLIVWQKARESIGVIYQLTKGFPIEEQFGLTSQMRRAAISISSNIAEGFGRRQVKDKDHFYTIALGSVSELLSQLIISGDLGYADDAELKHAKNKLVETRKLLLALLVSHRR